MEDLRLHGEISLIRALLDPSKKQGQSTRCHMPILILSSMQSGGRRAAQSQIEFSDRLLVQ